VIDPFRVCVCELGGYRATEGMANQMNILLNFQLFERHMQVLNELSHTVIPIRFIGLTMTTLVDSYHSIGDGEFIELILPLTRLSTITV
jgi:hypothetical protein